jgi:hypothetical protein
VTTTRAIPTAVDLVRRALWGQYARFTADAEDAINAVEKLQADRDRCRATLERIAYPGADPMGLAAARRLAQEALR